MILGGFTSCFLWIMHLTLQVVKQVLMVHSTKETVMVRGAGGLFHGRTRAVTPASMGDRVKGNSTRNGQVGNPSKFALRVHAASGCQ